MLVIPLHNGDELDVMRVELIPEKPVDVYWMVGVFRIDCAEDVELHLVLLEQPGSPHHPIEGSMASFVFPVEIVKFL